MISVQEAFDRVQAHVQLLDVESVPVDRIAGRVIASDLKARRSQPAADLSAMDGFAVKSADLKPSDAPVSFRLVGESAAGHPYTGSLNPGECVRIFTGAQVPEGADQVVIQENCNYADDLMQTAQSPSEGANIRRSGADFRTGEIVLSKGRTLSSQMVPLIAGSGHGSVPTYRAPRIAVFGTGDELVSPDAETFEAYQTVDSARPLLNSMMIEAGGEVAISAVLPDNLEYMTQAFDRASNECDLVITIGGASVGDHDYVGNALMAAGFELDFWKMAMRPGKPMMLAKKKNCTAIGLPGNAVSAYVCGRLFAVPAVKGMMGHPTLLPSGETANLVGSLAANGPRTHYMRARIVEDGKDGLLVEPLSSQDSSRVSLLALADGLIVRKPDASALSSGAAVSFIKF